MRLSRLGHLLTVPIKRPPVSNGQALSKDCVSGVGSGYAGQMQQVRRHAPICGPPRYPLSTAKKFLLGWVPLLLMMVIPTWALFRIPRWSAMHNNRPYGDEEEMEE
ncbi:uncharacterized protein LOC115483207 [Drosophila hydei]|uniref:Uncharacterized protein LOC115483207 n=1 Tax=Drosophila hydei TaxID=7224 RepID=A0A6J2ST56_DROHY|nr:uncharacterized protein LOC115483207 [Drosophila hydei]